jgi:aminoglycoside phosphotransferase
MIADVREALQPALSELLGREVEISEPVLLAGGASKEAWAVDADGERLLVRRAAASVMHRHTLSLRDELAVLEAAHEAGVKSPRPYGYIPDLVGREAFAMERLEGETIGRRIVRKEELARAREALPVQMAEELAKIHAIPAERVSFLPESRLEQMADELEDVDEPHAAIELGLWWLRENRPPARPLVFTHGDYRIGNLVVGEDGLVGVLDWVPVVFAGAGAAAAVSLAVTALDVARGRPARHAPAWAFGLVPPAGFALQELLELSLHTGTFGWRAILAPTFLPGLLLQLPFALAAYVAARLLLRAAEQIGRAFAPPLGAAAYVQLVLAPAPAAVPTDVAASSRHSRAPPHVAVV